MHIDMHCFAVMHDVIMFRFRDQLVNYNLQNHNLVTTKGILI